MLKLELYFKQLASWKSAEEVAEFCMGEPALWDLIKLKHPLECEIEYKILLKVMPVADISLIEAKLEVSEDFWAI